MTSVVTLQDEARGDRVDHGGNSVGNLEAFIRLVGSTAIKVGTSTETIIARAV